MLPTLLAAYRKYGSLADGWPVFENHFCSSGAVVEMTKNGSPNDTTSSSSTPSTWLDSPAGANDSRTVGGSQSATRARRTIWQMTCVRGLSRVEARWA